MLGYHFRVQIRVAWPLLGPLFDQRARLLGCPTPGGTLKPFGVRATISGTIDQRLRQGRLRYDVVLYGEQNQPADVQFGLTDPNLQVRFGVDERARGDWSSPDTLVFSSGGLVLPEQRTIDDAKNLPSWVIAKIDFWSALAQLAEIAAGAAPPPLTRELASAPGWQLAAAARHREPELVHAHAGLSFTITPLMA